MAKLVSQFSLVSFLRKGHPSELLTTFRSHTPHCLYSTDFLEKGRKKATRIKKLHRENKEIFGELLETKQDKLKKIKAVDRLKRKEKKEVKSSILSLDVSEYEDNSISDDSPTHKRPSKIPASETSITASNDINKPSSKSEKDLLSEINWTMKNFPQRTQIISRSKPEIPLQSFEASSKANVQFRKLDPNEMQKISDKEIQQVPSIKQFLSMADLTDLHPTTQTHIVRSSSQINETNVDDRNEITFNDTLLVDIYMENGIQGKDGNDLKDPGIRQIDTQATSSVNTKPKLETNYANSIAISYDNPSRSIVETAKLTSNSQHEIMNLQYDYKNRVTPCLPSVSKILQATMSPEQAQILEKWEQKMIEQMGEDGFKKYKEALFANGKELHRNIQSVLSGTPREFLTIDDSIFGHWNSLQNLLPEIQNVQVLESLVVHPQLHYCGIVDCVASYRNKVVLIDWKTSEKRKSFVSMTYDTPLQISAYVGALNHDSNYSFKITEGLIVIAYQDGTKCQLFHLNSNDLNKYWNQWVARLNLFKKKVAKTAV